MRIVTSLLAIALVTGFCDSLEASVKSVPDARDPRSVFPAFLLQKINHSDAVALGQQYQDLDPNYQVLALHERAVEEQRLGNRDQAIRLLERIVALSSQMQKLNPDLVLPSVNLLLALYVEKGLTREATGLVKTAIAIGEKGANNRNRAQTWTILAELQRSNGKYSSARSAARTALELTQDDLSIYPAFFEGVQNQLARIAYETSDLRSAAEHWKMALHSLSARRPYNDEEVLSLRVDLARISVEARRLAEAESELMSISATAEKYGRDVALARAQYVLGTLYVAQRKPAKAEDAFNRSLASSDERLSEFSGDSALSILALATLHLKARRPEASLRFTSRAILVLKSGDSIPLVWLDVLQIHAVVLKKLRRKQESQEAADLAARLAAQKRAGNQTIDVRDLRSQK